MFSQETFLEISPEVYISVIQYKTEGLVRHWNKNFVSVLHSVTPLKLQKHKPKENTSMAKRAHVLPKNSVG